MRFANLLVSGLGIIGFAIAVYISWKWRQLPVLSPSQEAVDSNLRSRLGAAIRSVGAVCTAGTVAGLLVLGLVGRLVMRILGATSADAQGRETDAGFIVGEITFGGMFFFLIFVGLLGGIAAAVSYLIFRSWLPAKAWSAGLVLAMLAIGTLGVNDALSPNNHDFQILTPKWLAVALVVGTGLLFALTFTALAARLDRYAKSPGGRHLLLYPSFVVGLAPPVALAFVVHIAVRVIPRTRYEAFTQNSRVRSFGHVVVALATILTTFVSLRALCSASSEREFLLV